jgi:hypothetical protein
MAQQIAQAASDFEKQRTNNALNLRWFYLGEWSL